jgi:hypothetical protein
MTRQDVHRPSVITPEDYDFVGFVYLGEHTETDRTLVEAHMKSTGGTYSQHSHGGNCHICGAHAIYTALFHHMPSNTYVRTGLDCAEKLGNYDSTLFRRQVKKALEQNAGKRKAQALLNERDLGAVWAVFTSQANGREEDTIKDIVWKLVRYGSISEKQYEFLRRLLHSISNRAVIEAQRAAEAEAAAPVPETEARIAVIGTVLSIRAADDNDQFNRTRILIKHRDGYKLWGTLPAALSGVAVGADVQFSAKVKRSDKDTKFGFFSRPTKAKQVSA